MAGRTPPFITQSVCCSLGAVPWCLLFVLTRAILMPLLFQRHRVQGDIGGSIGGKATHTLETQASAIKANAALLGSTNTIP